MKQVEGIARAAAVFLTTVARWSPAEAVLIGAGPRPFLAFIDGGDRGGID